MDNINKSLHDKVHCWTDAIGFRLNASQTTGKSQVTTKHYFFETFNFFERFTKGDLKRSSFSYFDTYGEKVNAKTLLDLQTAFFENISQLK